MKKVLIYSRSVDTTNVGTIQASNQFESGEGLLTNENRDASNTVCGSCIVSDHLWTSPIRAL